MPRRRQGAFEDFVDAAANLPWWMGVALALLSYVGLSLYANRPLPPPQPGEGIGDQAGKGLLYGFAATGRYFLPLVFLLGAGVSAFRSLRRKRLHARAGGEGGAEVVGGMGWREFELLVGEAFRQQGFSVLETGGGGADGGVDLILTRGSERFLVQCKQWRAQRVGVTTVRELYGVMAAEGAAGGFVVTSGTFTSDAKAFAEGRNIETIDGVALAKILKKRHATAPAGGGGEPARRAAPSVDASPRCPRCNSAMTQRVAKKGASAGTAFWGCTKYPGCNGTRPIDVTAAPASPTTSSPPASSGSR